MAIASVASAAAVADVTAGWPVTCPAAAAAFAALVVTVRAERSACTTVDVTVVVVMVVVVVVAVSIGITTRGPPMTAGGAGCPDGRASRVGSHPSRCSSPLLGGLLGMMWTAWIATASAGNTH